MKLWDISGDGGFWKVQLDVRDLGGHLDFTFSARAGTLSRRELVRLLLELLRLVHLPFRVSSQAGSGSG